MAVPFLNFSSRLTVARKGSRHEGLLFLTRKPRVNHDNIEFIRFFHPFEILVATAHAWHRARRFIAPSRADAEPEPLAGDFAQRRQHGRDRPLHHDPDVHRGNGRPARGDRLGGGCGGRGVRRPGLERAGGGDAGKRRVVPLPEAGLRRALPQMGPIDALPVYLAVSDQRHARDGIGICRDDALRELYLSRTWNRS